MKKILIVSGIIVALGGIIFYYLISYSNKGVKVEINVPSDEVSVGVPFDVDVIFTNETGNSLGDVKITLDPSEQIVFDSSGMSNIEARELGEIKNGSTVRESFKVVALPGEEPQYKAVATVFYSPASLVAEFKKKQETKKKKIYTTKNPPQHQTPPPPPPPLFFFLPFFFSPPPKPR